MTDLEDVWGEEFAQNVKQKTAERRQERNRVSHEELKKICSLAINEGKFDPEEGEPMFSHTTDNGITHQVLLMQVPDPEGSEVWEHLSEPWEGAARLPLEYLGEWYWSTFPRREDLKKLTQGDYCIVVGSIDEQEGESGEVYRNIYPVRGIATLNEAKELAEDALADEGFRESLGDEEEEDTASDFADTSESIVGDAMDESEEEEENVVEEEEAEEESSGGLMFDTGSSSDSDDDSSSGDGGGLKSMLGGEQDEEEDEEETVAPYEPVAHTLERLAEQQDEDEKPGVWEIEEGSPKLQRLTTVVINKTDAEGVTKDNEGKIKEIVYDVIENHAEQEDEDDEEDDDDMNKLF